MRAKQAEEVREIAARAVEEWTGTQLAAIVRRELASAAQQTAREAAREAERVVDRRIGALPDPEQIASKLFSERISKSSDLRKVVRTEAEKIVDGRVPGVVADLRPELADEIRKRVEEVLRSSSDLAELVRKRAVEGAAAETKRLLRGEYDTAVFKIAEATVADVVRLHAERVIREGALPRRVEVSVGGGPVQGVDGDTHELLPDLLLALEAGCHVLLVGPAGTGKSTMAKQAAQALGLSFHALSVGPTTPTSKMFGYLDAGGSYHTTPLREAYDDGGLMLLDELDNGHPGLLAELNQALSLDVCAFPDGMVERHARFRMVATANTYGHGGERQYVGRQAVDAATLDRLLVMDVPVDEAMERRVTLAHAPHAQQEALAILDEVRRLRRAAAEKKLPVMFSPRASIHAARLLEAGAEIEKVRRWCIVRGVSQAHRTALGMRTSS